MNTSRRTFLASTLATAGITALKPAFANATWSGWKPGEFQAHFIYTGVAESIFVILPDATTALIDCGDHAAVTRLDLAIPVLPNPGRLAGDWIARYVTRVNPNRDVVDYLVLTHLHSDHAGTPCWQSRRVLKRGEKATGLWRSGFGLAAETLHFKKAIDRGWPDYDEPTPYKDADDDWSVLEHMRKIYAFLQKRDGLTVEKFRVGATDQFVPLRDPSAVKGFSFRNVCGNGKVAFPDGTIVDTLLKNGQHPTWMNENNYSIGGVFTYGKFKLYTAGDFSGPVTYADKSREYPEKLIGKAVGPVDVAKVNHHGHRSMPPELVRELRAHAYVACVWDQLHMTDDCMASLVDRSLYPDDRLILPGIMPAERRATPAAKAWLKDVPEAVHEGSHVVLTVPEGGETYRLTCLSAADESMRVKATFDLVSRG